MLLELCLHLILLITRKSERNSLGLSLSNRFNELFLYELTQNEATTKDILFLASWHEF